MPGLSNWKLLSNYQATFNLEKVNLLSNPNVNPKNGVAYEKMCKSNNSQNFLNIQEPQWLPSEQAPNLGLTTQIGNFWLTHCYISIFSQSI